MSDVAASSDYPAAHSMDTTWFAVDASGRVAHFDTGENGAVPHAWLGNVDVGYDLADVLFARDLRARFLSGELSGHPDPDDLYDAFVVVSDPSDFVAAGATLLVEGSPSVVLVSSEAQCKVYAFHEAALASVPHPEEFDFARFGVFEYEHAGPPGGYRCLSAPSAPLKLDALPVSLRDAVSHVALDTAFGAVDFQLADHTRAANYWYAGSRSLRGGPPDDDDIPSPPHPVFAWLGADALPEDRDRGVPPRDLIVPIAATMLAIEGKTLAQLAESSPRVRSFITSLRGPRRAGEPTVGFGVRSGDSENIEAYVESLFDRGASPSHIPLQLAMLCRRVSARPNVSRDKLTRTLRADMRTANVTGSLRASNHHFPFATVFYASRDAHVVLAQEALGDAVLYRAGDATRVVRGPIQELLAMLDEPHFTPATEAVMSAPERLYRIG